MNKETTGPRTEGPLAFTHARVSQVRIARPTNQLERVVAFYRDGLGLPELYRFVAHDGYDGVMLGLPGAQYHLEFTQRSGDGPCLAPSRDNLLVIYIPDRAELERLQSRLEERGHPCVPPENPYWAGHSVTFEDPDGWRVVLCNGTGI
jgi:catechol 2,3-dioxygenase-like lactoylglutathione lyase family enzyme